MPQTWRGEFAAVLIVLTTLLEAQTPRRPPTQPDAHSVEVQMRNVVYHFTDNIAVHIRRLHGRLVPTKGDVPVFDDKESFKVLIESAEMTISAQSLANVLNSYVFTGRDAPLRGISTDVDGSRLKIRGRIHSKGDIGFETGGTLSATPDGKIRLHIEKIKALHLPVKGVMDLLGVEMADLIQTGKVRGVKAEKDDLILDPETLLPPPHITGQVTAVRLEPNEIVQVFGAARDSMPMHVGAANYMAYRGNNLRFGKLTMNDTDMVLIDLDPKDPFDFYLDHYKEQLVAGYTKETMSFGLRVFMRDYNKLRRSRSAAASR